MNFSSLRFKGGTMRNNPIGKGYVNLTLRTHGAKFLHAEKDFLLSLTVRCLELPNEKPTSDTNFVTNCIKVEVQNALKREAISNIGTWKLCANL
jgi:hypothetical protein